MKYSISSSPSKPLCLKLCQIIFESYWNMSVEFLGRESDLSKNRNFYSGWRPNVFNCWTRSSLIAQTLCELGRGWRDETGAIRWEASTDEEEVDQSASCSNLINIFQLGLGVSNTPSWFRNFKIYHAKTMTEMKSLTTLHKARLAIFFPMPLKPYLKTELFT